MQNPKKKA